VKRVSLVVTDVDGTLVTRDKVLTTRSIEAVERLHASGIAFSICSSRPPFGMRMLVEPLRLKLPFGAFNAGAIVEPDLPNLTVVEQKLILPQAAKRAVTVFREHGIDCWLFTGNEWLITNPSGDHVEHEARTVRTPPTVVPEFSDAHFAAIGKIVGPSVDHARVALLTELLQGELAGRANVARSQPYYCDVIPPGIDKGRLIALLAGRLGIPRAEVFVLGDMENDLTMFREAGFAVAMGNAVDAVKHQANAVTLSNDEDGFAAAIEQHVFGNST
jgi:Cof subfamily protein (haloacid dehalogenase superfamily)